MLPVFKPTDTIEIFISYSHEDEELWNQLDHHLILLRRRGYISTWYDRDISAGRDWATQIDAHLESAHIILLLISADFLGSDYCYSVEMQRALERHQNGEACVIPIILRPVDWQLEPSLSRLQALPTDGKPVSIWQDQDEAFYDIAKGIRKVVEKQYIASNTARTQYPPSTHRSVSENPPSTDSEKIQQREKVVKEVYKQLVQTDITAVVLTGIGGLGKSILAALVYHYAEDQRRAGLGPFTADALWLHIDQNTAMVDIAITLLEALGKPEASFNSLSPRNQASALFNALNTVDNARLIILDQFEHLLGMLAGHSLPDHPGVGEWLDIINSQKCTCRILITSRPLPRGRSEFPLTYIQEYPVQGLGTSEGVSLLRKQGVGATQATDAELQQAVERCNGHALALTLLASILCKDRGLNLKRLFDDPIYASLWRENIARSLLNYIYIEQLNDEQRQLLQAFSVYREPVPLEAAHWLIHDMPSTQILDAQNVLLAQHLLNAVGEGEGRYQLHAIVASYAQAKLQTVREMHKQAAQYYLQQSKDECPPTGERYSIKDVQPLIDATWHFCQARMLRSAWNLIQQEGIFSDLKHWGGNASLLELYTLLLSVDTWPRELMDKARIYTDLGEIYSALGQKERVLNYYLQALNIYKESEDRQSESRVLSDLGGVYSTLGQKDRAQEYYQEALNIYVKLGNREGEGIVLHNFGEIYDELGQNEIASKCFEQAKAIFQEAGDDKRVARTLTKLGLVSSELGHYEEAKEYCKQAVRITRVLKDLEGEGETLYNLGLVSSKLGQNAEALIYLMETLKISRMLRDRWQEGRRLNALGRVYYSLGQRKEAQKCYEQSLSISKEVKDPKGEGESSENLGQFYYVLGQKEKAKEYFEQAFEIFKEIKDRDAEVRMLNALRMVYEELRRHEEAQRCYEQALQMNKEVRKTNVEGRSLISMGLIFSKLGRKEDALQYFKQALHLSRQVRDYAGEERTLHNLGGIYDSLGQKQKALEYFEQALTLMKEQGDHEGEGRTLYRLGMVYEELGRHEEAQRYYEQALQMNKEVKDREAEGKTFYRLGSIYSMSGQKREARNYFGQALTISKEVGDRKTEGIVLSDLGMVCDELGQKEQAREYLKQALAIFNEIGDEDDKGLTLNRLGNLG